jgi:uncharacterized protein with HEPN domain
MYNNPEILLEDVQSAIEKILAYTKGLSFEGFTKDEMRIDAVIRNFEIIGEVASKLSDSFKEAHPDIDWFQIKGMRNRIVHDYRNVNLFVVWDAIENDLPSLKTKIAAILKSTR